jgi:heme oxygenase (biliverdin-IX-beta and delta-forming)
MPAVDFPTDTISDSGANTSGAKTQTGKALRATLRSGTADAHARLDAQLGLIDLHSLPHYRGFLEAFGKALLPLETALSASGVERTFIDWPQRARSRALLDDVSRLRGTVRPFGALGPFDFDAMLGTMYVLEGSRLGAKVLLAEVLQAPDPVVAKATAFLRHGFDSRLWQSFLQILDRNARKVGDPDKVVAAARFAFELFEVAAFGLIAPAHAAESIVVAP